MNGRPDPRMEQGILQEDEGKLQDALDAGDDPNRRSVNDQPLLHAAISKVRNGASGMVAPLLRAGASPEARHEGRTPLMAACMQGKLYAVQALIKGGAQLDAVDPDGWSAMMWATAHSSPYNGIAIIHLLLDAGANPQITSETGSNLLMLAANKGMPDIVARLIEMGVDACKRNNAHLRASDCAMRGVYRGDSHKQCQTLLLQAEGISDTAVDLDVETPVVRGTSRSRRL